MMHTMARPYTAGLLLIAGSAVAQEQRTGITMGAAPPWETILTYECPRDPGARIAYSGEVTDAAGRTWMVPGPITEEGALPDIYNDCIGAGDNPGFVEELETAVVDEDGEEVTAYLFADNYFELYVNGEYVGRDSIAFTPFNSAAARFRASYPITYAVRLTDWEGFPGTGLEITQGAYHIGDGGFIASFSDGTQTGADWQCKVFYVAPLDDAAAVPFDAAGNADSSTMPSSDDTVACIANDPESTCQALHIAVPPDVTAPAFDDSGWLPATTYHASEVTASPGFADYADSYFADADFIWTSNLDLDNYVVCRYTVEGP